MGDHDECATAWCEVVREPCHRLDVEVVGRLVEHEQVGITDEKVREGGTPPLTARHRADHGVEAVGVPLRGVSAEQTTEHVAHARVAEPLVLGAVPHDHVAQRVGIRQVVALREDTDREAAETNHTSGVDRLEPGEDADQRGLAATVATDDAHAGPFGHAESHIAKEGARAKGLADSLERDIGDRCHQATSR